MTTLKKPLGTKFEQCRAGFLLNPGGRGRYSWLKDGINLVWGESDISWNPWFEDQLQTLCDDAHVVKEGPTTVRFVSWTGPGACVRGDTRIDDPIRKTTRTIQDLCESGIAPYVMTLSGPVLATVPFVKGFDDLYEVVLENGNKFIGTADHRVLSTSGDFCRVCDLRIGSQLLGYSPFQPQSISEFDLSIRASNESRSMRIAPGFQCDCPVCSNSCDERFPSDQGIFRYVSPLQADALGHNPPYFCVDVRIPSQEYNRSCQLRDHLSSWGSFPLGYHTEIPLSVHAFEGKQVPDDVSSQPSFRSWSKKGQNSPVELPDRDYGSRHLLSCSKYTVQPSKVSRISRTGRHLFYDLCVPDVHHYFAEGAIHHNSGKTFSSGVYAMFWFLCAPHKSCVTLTSTSKQAMGSRVWAVIASLFLSGKHPDTGEDFDWHIINSKKVLQWPKGDEKHNIACFAVEEGEVMKSVDRIKGRHTERMLLIVDEANSTPEAIFKVIPNMRKGCKELVVLVFDNAGNMYGNHGRCCEPKTGWSSISVDDERWETKGVPEWDLPPGICRHYDGEKSPNVLAGKTIYPHIYSFENWKTAMRSGGDSLHYWSQDRGFWPPEGATNTVFSGPLINRCDGTGFAVIVSNKETYAFLDPGFGGDRCVLQLADVGVMDNGKIGIQLRSPIYIEPKVDIEAERDYQVGRIVIENCKANSVKPSHYGGDATGIGRGVHAIIAGEWSQEIQRVEWNGKASDKPSSQADGRPAHEVYNDFVTELWFAAREFVESGQLKGLYPEAVKQGCSRTYEQQGRKFQLASKDDCKKILGYSPDEFDAIAGLVEVVRRNGISAEGKLAQNISSSLDGLRLTAQKDLALDLDGADSAPDSGGWAERDPQVRIDWQDQLY